MYVSASTWAKYETVLMLDPSTAAWSSRGVSPHLTESKWSSCCVHGECMCMCGECMCICAWLVYMYVCAW